MSREETKLTVREEARASFARLVPRIQALLPRVVSTARFEAVALGVLNRPDLAGCLQENPLSVFGAILQSAQLGLLPNGLQGEAYILPFKVKGVPTATFVPGYKGYVALMWRSGKIKDLHVDVVHEKDEFAYYYDLAQGGHVLHHDAYDGNEEPGDVTSTYAVAELLTGGRIVVRLTRRQIDKVRASSKAAEGPAWTLWFEQMVMKTALRRLPRLAPMSTELQTASGLDEASVAGKDVDLSSLVDDAGLDGAAFVEHEEAPSKEDKLKDKLKKDQKGGRKKKKDEADAEHWRDDQGGPVEVPPAEEPSLEGTVEHPPNDEGNPFQGWDK